MFTVFTHEIVYVIYMGPGSERVQTIRGQVREGEWGPATVKGRCGRASGLVIIKILILIS